MDAKHQSAITDLADLDMPELIAAHHAAKNRKLAAAESAKTHPLSGFSLPANEWAELKAHIMDGGGVVDDRELAKSLLQAIFDDNQSDFWPGLAHLVKARAKIHGRMRALPHGGVSFSGVGPLHASAKQEPSE